MRKTGINTKILVNKWHWCGISECKSSPFQLPLAFDFFCDKQIVIKVVFIRDVFFGAILVYFGGELLPVSRIFVDIYFAVTIKTVRIFFTDIVQDFLLVVSAEIQIFKPVFADKFFRRFNDFFKICYVRKYGRHK